MLGVRDLSIFVPFFQDFSDFPGGYKRVPISKICTCLLSQSSFPCKNESNFLHFLIIFYKFLPFLLLISHWVMEKGKTHDEQTISHDFPLALQIPKTATSFSQIYLFTKLGGKHRSSKKKRLLYSWIQFSDNLSAY